AASGAPDAFLPLIHFILLEYSHVLSEYLVSRNYELYGKRDARFIAAVYLVLREEFDYKPSISQKQFFLLGFAERKCLFLQDLFRLARSKIADIQRSMNLKVGRQLQKSVGRSLNNVNTSKIQAKNVISKGDERILKAFASREVNRENYRNILDSSSDSETNSSLSLNTKDDSRLFQSESVSMDESMIIGNSNNIQNEDQLRAIQRINQPQEIKEENLEVFSQSQGSVIDNFCSNIAKFKATIQQHSPSFFDEELDAAIHSDRSSMIIHRPFLPAPPPEERRDSIVTVDEVTNNSHDDHSSLMNKSSNLLQFHPKPNGDRLNLHFDTASQHSQKLDDEYIEENCILLNKQEDNLNENNQDRHTHPSTETTPIRGNSQIQSASPAKPERSVQEPMNKEVDEALAVVDRLEKMFATSSELGESLAIRLNRLETLLLKMSTTVFDRLDRLETYSEIDQTQKTVSENLKIESVASKTSSPPNQSNLRPYFSDLLENTKFDTKNSRQIITSRAEEARMRIRRVEAKMNGTKKFLSDHRNFECGSHDKD
ncbi:Centrosomal protein of 44 kDa, partial [Nowakowskiella sp. JEL0078]